MYLKTALRAATALSLIAGAAQAETITIATVNNGDMIRMQGLTENFNAMYPDITVKWVTLEKNVLRQNVTTDIAQGGGQYDIITIGTYEVPIWGARGWLQSLNDLGDDYNIDDLLPAIRGGLTVDGNLMASPFYGESPMVVSRTGLMQAAGLDMATAPSWDFVREAGGALTYRDDEVYGVCLRGQPG